MPELPFATILIGEQAVAFSVRVPVPSRLTRKFMHYTTRRGYPSERERLGLPRVERLTRQVLGLELKCPNLLLIAVYRVGAPSKGWEFCYSCPHGEYRVSLEIATFEGIEVVHAGERSALLRIPSSLLDAEA